ncbi:hypothetical protein SAMN02910301_0671 [Lachnospiraceae bacterium XBD2001]|nr:hypothetical protein SAMN02910301_0671 [Lachnospiraceae bacterium XBD2001]
MKIAESTIQMNASRQAWQMGSRGSLEAQGAKAFQNIAASMFGTKYDTYLPGNGADGTMYGNPYNKNGIAVSDIGQTDMSSTTNSASKMQYDLLGMLWQRMMQSMGIFTAGSGGMVASAGLSSTYVQQVDTYSEYEATCFHAQGQALTEDGRSLEFSIDISMSRSYREYMNVETPLFQNLLMDPLVVNVSGETLSVSDQTFFFDLDGDGTEEEINQLGAGSGFLALDKNGDGKINDGTELFGTQSGDGFGDLRAYDSDGNGWIDENDEIFDKLRVWCKGENGEDILMSLKDADVGAIYLGEEKTDFSMTDSMGGMAAMLRSTGIFLRESGSASTLQHVDMVIHQAIEQVQEMVMESTTVNNGVVTTTQNGKALEQDAANQDVVKQSAKDDEELRRQSETEKRNMEARRERRRAERKALNEAAAKRREEHKEIAEENFQRQMEHRRRWKEHISQEKLESAYGIG